ncbi:kelch-like protein 7 [Porites lutea]|uniref:kelch-like protein 7 n=1 Tax=Porites lutea TaxID=51062 RepID=UPI003CC689C1
MADLTEPMTADPAKHREELLERLDALRRKETFCDVTVAVNGKEFKANKVVLAAASPFFLSLLENDMRERNEQRIEIKLEEATASVMEDVLEYIYTGNVSVTEESCHNLIATADYLLLPGLKTLAVEFLKEKVTVQNCVFNYYFANKYRCTELTEICCSVINLNFSDVMKTDDFLNLDMKQVMEWVSGDDINVRAEEEVFTGIVDWVSHNRSDRESCFPDLIRQIRLRPSSQDILLKKLVNEDLVTTNIECMNFVLRSITDSDESLSREPRNCLKVQVEGIFLCGGRKALCYLPQVNMWYKMVDMSFEHQNHSLLLDRQRVYIFSKQNRCHLVEYYVPSTNLWCSFQSGFKYNEQFCSVSAGSGYSFLNALTYNEHIPYMYTYDINTNKWNMQEESPINRWGVCAISQGHHIYIIGGTQVGDSVAAGNTKVERFNPSNESVEEVAPLNEARHDAFGAVMNDKIYVAGGIQMREQRCILLNTCEVYDPSTNEWHLMAGLCVPRHSASMVCFKEALYVIGGLKNTNNQVVTRELSVEMFDSEISEWKEKSTIPVGGETEDEREKQIHYKACTATIHKDVLVEENLIDNVTEITPLSC